MMTKVSEMFPPKWLSAAEIEGKVYRLVISAYGIEKYDDGNKMTINFQGVQKGLVLNATNRGTLVWLFGDEADQWVGKEIELFTEPVTFKGKTSAGLKVRGVNSIQVQSASVTPSQLATQAQAPLGEPGAQPTSGPALPGAQPTPIPVQPSNAQLTGPGELAAAETRRTESVSEPLPDDPIPF